MYKRQGYDCKDADDAVNYPAWRGVYDYTKTGYKVDGKNHNTAIKGLFKPLTEAEIAAAEADGYVKTAYGIVYAENEATYVKNQMGGITSATEVPRYFFPIPFETLSQSKGAVTNGYGLPQE